MTGIDSDIVFEPYEKDELHRAYYRIAQLEEDQQMLNDLIEMLFDEDITGLHFGEFNKTFYLYDDTEEKINSNGSTPREAIAAAIAEWKGKQNDKCQMKLSQQIHHDFLKDVYPENMKVRTYEMSYDYLIDLIRKVKELEEAAKDDN